MQRNLKSAQLNSSRTFRSLPISLPTNSLLPRIIGSQKLYSGLGLVYYRRQNYQESVKELQQATQGIATPDPVDYYVLGSELQNLGRFSEAFDAFEKCGSFPGALQDRCKQGAEQAKNNATFDEVVSDVMLTSAREVLLVFAFPGTQAVYVRTDTRSVSRTFNVAPANRVNGCGGKNRGGQDEGSRMRIESNGLFVLVMVVISLFIHGARALCRPADVQSHRLQGFARPDGCSCRQCTDPYLARRPERRDSRAPDN